MEKFYFNDIFGSMPTDTFNKIDKMFDDMFNSANTEKIIIVDTLDEVAREVEKKMIEKQKSEEKREKTCKCKKMPTICFDIQSILANHEKNAFTVIWADGTKTMIHCQPGDVWDNEKALAMCFVKHLCEDKGSFNDIFNEEMPAKLKEIKQKERTELKPATGRREDGMIPNAEKGRYNVFYGPSMQTATPLAANCTVSETRHYMKDYIRSNYPRLLTTPNRVWSENGVLYIDFGASEYIMIPGMSEKTWLNK